MGTTNVDNGMSFEYACLTELASLIRRRNGKPSVEMNKRFLDASAAFLKLDMDSIRNMRLAAAAGMEYVLACEPRLRLGFGLPVRLSLQEDWQGQIGDVRDILCVRAELGWEIGISCKHNHEAVKHSRLSPTIDFGMSWLGRPCSDKYFTAINPVFDELTQLRRQKVSWRDVPGKSSRFYKPVLQAFVDELRRIDSADATIVAPNLIRYLLGRKSFYKVMSHDGERTTSVQAFDFEQNLNLPGADANNRLVKPDIRTRSIRLPCRVLSLGFVPDSESTVEIQCEDGWVLSFRLHNASSRVEPSLKFDIQLKASPTRAMPVILPWGKWQRCDDLIDSAPVDQVAE